MGRPKKEIDADQVFELASIMCTMIEMAAVLDCSVDTLENRFSDVIKRGREVGKQSLRRLQYKSAQTGNTTMLIWLGKQYLGQTDKLPEFSKLSDAELVQLISSAALGVAGASEADADETSGDRGIN